MHIFITVCYLIGLLVFFTFMVAILGVGLFGGKISVNIQINNPLKKKSKESEVD